MTARFAIVGSGPAGCYLADALARAMPGAVIDVFERLDEPFGLVRFGVAPDHEQTRAIARVLRRPFDRGAASLHLGMEVGRDIGLNALRRDYDAVALATGAPVDRRLGVPGEGLAEPSGRFIRWINGHPEAAPPARLAGARRAVVIGAGNVALDAVRLLAKHREIDCLNPLALERIDLLIRSGPEDVRFSPTELLEIGELAAAWPDLDAFGDAAGEAAAVLADFAARPPGRGIPVRFHFHTQATAFLGAGRLEAVRTGRGVLPADLAVTCIGYEKAATDGVRPTGPEIEPGLYAVGWAARGPTGTIPTNRAEARVLAKRMVAGLEL
ncbi:MAG: FAD-dependent oxidoreductase [Alphaproteobacteria bacterium]|nr:FAD-dependent oxidoreductase [Alphaproteobacteria bacterium]